jgi:hypothetical protein
VVRWPRALQASRLLEGPVLATLLRLAAPTVALMLLQTEHFPMSRINGDFRRLESGKALYCIVLDADF